MYYIDYPSDMELCKYKLISGVDFVRADGLLYLSPDDSIKVRLRNTVDNSSVEIGAVDLVREFGLGSKVSKRRVINARLRLAVNNESNDLDYFLVVYKMGTYKTAMQEFLHMKYEGSLSYNLDNLQKIGIDSYTEQDGMYYYNGKLCKFRRMQSLFSPIALSVSGNGLMFLSSDVSADFTSEFAVLIMKGCEEYDYERVKFSSLYNYDSFCNSDLMKSKLEILNSL